jgi:hypothetical protein
MKGTGGGNSSSSGQRFDIEEMDLMVGMGAVVSGKAKGAFIGAERWGAARDATDRWGKWQRWVRHSSFFVLAQDWRGDACCKRGRGGIVVSCIRGAGEQSVARWARGQEAGGGGAVKVLEEGDNERTLGRERPGGLGVWWAAREIGGSGELQWPGGQLGWGSSNKRREEIGNGLGRWAEKGFWARIGKWLEKKIFEFWLLKWMDSNSNQQL